MRFDAKASVEHKRAARVKSDLDLTALAAMEPDELDAWLEANVMNMNQVRELLKSLVPAVLMVMDRGA